MAYFAIYDNSTGRLASIGVTSVNGSPYEITEAEYNRLTAYISEKSAYVQAVYSGETAIDDVPEEFRDDVQREVDAIKAADEEAAQQEVSGDELLSMIEGVL